MTRRLLFTYLSFALLIVLGLEMPLGYLQQNSERHRALAQLEHDAEVLAVFVDADMHHHDIGRIEVLAHAAGRRLGGYVDIVNADADVLVTTRPAPAVFPPDSDMRAVLQGQGRVSSRIATVGGSSMMSVAVLVHAGVAPQGALRLSVPTDVVNRRVERFWLMLAAGGLLALAAAAVIAVALSRWISRPVRALEQATRRLADDAAPPPALSSTTGPPELRRLAATFTATAERLHALISSQRSFIGHASHQLKTPLAALRLRLENLEPDIAPAGDRNLQAALIETDRLARMVESLLSMARYEQTTLPREPLRLAEAVTERISFWTPLATTRSVRLTTTGPADTYVAAVGGTVDQILDNLLSNALRAAPSGSTVAITWRSVPTDGPEPLIEIHVVDEGAGLTPEQCTQAMEPFWRAPGSPTDGTGLGLPLVRKLAQASGGHATLRPAARHRGVDAVITLPAAESSALDRDAAGHVYVGVG